MKTRYTRRGLVTLSALVTAAILSALASGSCFAVPSLSSFGL